MGDVPPAAGRGVQGGLEPNHIHEGNHGMTAYPRLLGVSDHISYLDVQLRFLINQ